MAGMHEGRGLQFGPATPPCEDSRMSILKALVRQIASKATGRRVSTPAQVRELIDRREFDAAAGAIDDLPPDLPRRDIEIMSLQAELAFRQFRDEDADRLFRSVLRLDPGAASAHYGLSLMMHAKGDMEAALRHAQFAINRTNMEPRFCAQLGLCHVELGNFGPAAVVLGRATRLNAADKSSWNNLGIARRAGSNLDGARKAFRRALDIDPGFAAAQANLEALEDDLRRYKPVAIGGAAKAAEPVAPDPLLAPVRALADDDRLDEAIDLCERLCVDHPDSLPCVAELYRLYSDLGDVRSGLDALEAFRESHPSDIGVVAELGKALEREQQHQLAEPLLERALEALPDDVSLLLSLADVRVDQGRHTEAGALVERAYALEPTLQMKGRVASSLLLRCRYADCLRLVEEIIAEEPATAVSMVGVRVDAMAHLGRQAEALPLLDKEIERSPYVPMLRFPRAEIRLLNEEFGPGWDDYAFRNLSSTRHLRMVAFPQWKGEPLEGKSILVLAEQGLGDQVMFASCLPDLLALGPARVVVEVVKRVAPTIARSFPQCEIVPTKQDAGLEWVRDIGDMDYFVPIGDLPSQFRRTRADFPDRRSYLVADEGRVAHWRGKLAALGPRPKIGVSWKGGTERTRTVLRTMGPALLAELQSAVDADWVCLQYGDVTQGLEEAAAAGLKLHYWKDAIDNLDEFAALVSALDLVVTVCNTTVHYAGAVGKDVWVMSPKVPEWRYGLRFESMPWYPSSRMFRQREDGDWDSVLTDVGRELSSRFGRPA